MSLVDPCLCCLKKSTSSAYPGYEDYPRVTATTLWLCGQWKCKVEDKVAWGFQGCFFTEEDAVKACRDANYFVVPVRVGEELPHKIQEWEGLYYPFTEKENAKAT